MCPSHLGAVGGRPRVPCPLDPNHTCYAHRVEQHVAKCPAAQRKAVAESAPYYCLNINLPGPVAAASAAAAASCAQAGPSSSGGGGGGGAAAAAAGEAKKRGGEKGEGDEGQPQQKKRKRRQQPPSIFASMRADEVDALVALVRTAHALHCREPLQTVMLRHPPCEPHFTPAKGACSVKHMTQQSSILAHMAAAGLLVDGACFIEFGAGRVCAFPSSIRFLSAI
ncbi:uncharacterized protein ACA1_180620 [Acanthamoeba castellanii str. Neff]|uniref:tRNA:m(4)X modification enzyme TRM13 n=1 Tax=Acanthamoeba castellanii (strain ATCC 30010 / Neff) TaxID=1257118 RepID=L8GCB2_ACACF|nr:uncharacterized protein ACA1_180620 [Acanthamoeba castellanii str. Neff]ELR10850.1 hypothetical protein ACA1_180620 [Acanthamoeba castellanii str. Neff]